MHWRVQCMAKGTSRAKVTLNYEKVKPISLSYSCLKASLGRWLVSKVVTVGRKFQLIIKIRLKLNFCLTDSTPLLSKKWLVFSILCLDYAFVVLTINCYCGS